MSSTSTHSSKLQGRNLNEFLATQKKLQNAWSAQYVARSLSASLLEDMCTNFDMLERKAKMRVLVSLLALDSKKKFELRSLLQMLLSVAVESSIANTSDVWVSITAGIVYERLFGNDGDEDGICKMSKASLQDTMGLTLEQVMVVIKSDGEGVEGNTKTGVTISPYTLPLKHNFLPLPHEVSVKATANSHFKYSGKEIDVLSRERKRQKVDDDLNENRSSLMNVGSSQDAEAKRRKAIERQESQRRAAVPISYASKEKTSLVASVASQGQKLSQASAQSISMEAIKASRLNPENLTAAERRELAKKAKVAARKEKEEAKMKEKEEKAATKAREAEERQRLAREKVEEIKNEKPALPADSLASSINNQQQQKQQLLSNSNSHVLEQVEASTLLSPENKALITSFFGGSSSSSGSAPTVPFEGVGRFLVKESPVVDNATGQKIGKEMTYLDLDYSAKSFKFITKKAFRKIK